MRLSEALIPTVKETPSDAEIISHKLMIRAGMMRKLGAGVYTYLPLGLKVIRKVEQIIREEMNRAGAQELLMPILSPAELWQESGRWDVYGKELMRFKDRHDRDFALGPTHEEIITALVRSEIRSYRQLPVNLYQIQTKFRDEIRPRFGVMRAREFVMKDAYSFHRDTASLEKCYKLMFETYTRIFKRCGLHFKPVLADSGAIGGDKTHEFHVLADAGESEILYSSDYAASSEYASGRIQPIKNNSLKEGGSLEKIYTPGIKTVEEVAGFFKVETHCLIKTLIYKVANSIIAVLIRGDREINESKLQRHFKTPFVELADEQSIRTATHADVGFAGPVGLSIPIYADVSLKGMEVGITGANETDYHFKNVHPDKDFTVREYIDAHISKAGDLCISSDDELKSCRGIEVGQVFQLGTKYSSALHAAFDDEDGSEKPFVMGCYGIGVTRTVAAAIEQSHDKDGIIWPYSIAPYHIIVLPLNSDDHASIQYAEKIYAELSALHYDVLLDDRDIRPGVKFKDADLLGIPIKIVIGKSLSAEGLIEIKKRIDGETFKVLPENLFSAIENIVRELEISVHE
ncbi:MAG: proline--tRNA ligase [bacterium]|nr:proline--tRNA ligase [bacterium]